LNRNFLFENNCLLFFFNGISTEFDFVDVVVVGFAVGFMLGAIVGAKLGEIVGFKLGEEAGAILGMLVGKEVVAKLFDDSTKVEIVVQFLCKHGQNSLAGG
jgi:outer membrane lipoprotein SlyB